MRTDAPFATPQNLARNVDKRAKRWIARWPPPRQCAAELRHPLDRDEAQVPHGRGGGDGGIDDLAPGDPYREAVHGAFAHRDPHTPDGPAPGRSGGRYGLVELPWPVVEAREPVASQLLHIHRVAIRQRVVRWNGELSGLLGEHGTDDQVALLQRKPRRHQVDVALA
jgi:hypothetical protein